MDYSIFKNTLTAGILLQFFLEIVFPAFAESMLLSYLSFQGGYYLNYSYTIPVALATILLPIFPNLNWFIHAILRYILYILLFLFVNYEETIKSTRMKRSQQKKQSPIYSIPIVFFIFIFAAFVAGFLPYKPVTIASNSMKPTLQRGDVCIVQKISEYKQIRQIQEGDIIEYQYNDIFIIHRVVEVQKRNSGYQYITKGDSNSAEDLLPVSENQVIGIVRYHIPYLGYPSVWFSEFLAGIKE